MGASPVRYAACGSRTCPCCAGSYGSSGGDTGSGDGAARRVSAQHRPGLCRVSDYNWQQLTTPAAQKGVKLKRCPPCGAAELRSVGCLNAHMKVTPPLAVAPLAQEDDMRWNPNDDGILF